MCEISVIIPLYNVERYINRCIDSVLAQTYDDFEIILVNDGSQDRSGEICDAYAREHDRITVIHQENRGLSAARNAGIDRAFESSDSEWITFIDSDDWIHPRYLEALIVAVKSADTSIGVCGFERTEGKAPEVNENNLSPVIYRPEDFFSEKNLNSVIFIGKLYKKSAFRQIRLPEGKIHEDEFVTYRILFQYDRLAFVSEPLYYYYRNPDSITEAEWSPKRMVKFEALQEQMAFFEKNGYEKAKKRTIIGFATACTVFMTQAEKQAAYKEYVIKIRRLLRRHIRKYRSILKQDREKYEWYRTCAYPLRDRIKNSVKVRFQRG